jgi:Lon protease-like protein
MYEIPLFPLDMVLFPGMPVHLHIFEERYKAMINTCMERRLPFGVVLIRRGLEANGPMADPYSIGVTASIVDMQPLDDGRMNITALGQDRFRIVSTKIQAQQYLSAVVDPFPLVSLDPQAVNAASARLRPWVEKYLQLLARAGNIQFGMQELPDDSFLLGNLASILLQVPNGDKQALLSMESAEKLVASLLRIYRREVSLLTAIVARDSGTDSSGFSLN